MYKRWAYMTKCISDLVITVRFYLAPWLKLTHSALRLTITHYATSEGSGATAHLEPSPFTNIYRQSRRSLPTHLFYHLLFTEISPYKAHGMECTICLWQPIKLSPKLIVSYPLRTQNEKEILKKMRLSWCNKLIQPPEKMAQCFYWGPSLSGAEMSQNP